jgi:hypothetical protein
LYLPATGDLDPAYFRLPSLPLEFKDGRPFKGWAINPFDLNPYDANPGAALGAVTQFELPQ